jgi:hypothetical protein
MLISPYRRMIALLVLMLILAEAGAVVFSCRASDIIATVLTLLGFILILAIVTLLIIRNGDGLFRVIVLIPVVGFLVFKLWVLFEFMTQVD